MKKNKILVPVDFSDCSNNAVDFAIPIAEKLNAEIIILHALIYNDTFFIDKKSKEEENTKRFNSSKQMIDELAAYINKKLPDSPAKTLLEGGPVKDVITDAIKDHDITFVVMGTEGATGLKAAILGSFTESVVKHAACPVFIIPPSSQYKGFHDILCATDLHRSEYKAVKKLLQIAKLFRSSITLYNVNDDQEKQNRRLAEFQKNIQPITASINIEYQLEQSDDVVHAIDDYACNKPPDLLVTLGKKRKFLSRIFSRGKTRNLCLHSVAPLLVFPASDFYYEKTEKA